MLFLTEAFGLLGALEQPARDALILLVGVVGDTYLVEERFALDLMELEAELPRVVAEQKTCKLLIREHWNAEAFLVVGLMFKLGDGVLPLVEKHVAAWTVGEDEVRLVRFHRLEFLLGIGDGVAAVFLNKILTETKTAAMATLGIVDDLAAPSLNHAGQDVWKLGFADTSLGKNLGIVATYVLDDTQGLARETVDELIFHLGLEVEAELEDEIGGVDKVFGGSELTFGGIPKELACLLQQTGFVFPFLQHFREEAEGGDTGGHIVLISAFAHEREEACHHGHSRFERYHIAMIADACASVLVRVVTDILAQLVAQDAEKCGFRTREEGLPYAAALIEKMVVSYFLLIFVPVTFVHWLMFFSRCSRCSRLYGQSRLYCLANVSCHYLGDVFDGDVLGAEESLLAHRTGRSDKVRVGCKEVVASGITYLCLLIEVKDRITEIESATEAFFAFAGSGQQGRCGPENVSWLLIDTAAATQLAGVVEGDLAAIMTHLEAAFAD